MIFRLAIVAVAAPLSGALAAPPHPTAFRALFEAGKQAPGASLVSITGNHGAPQPAAWLFLYADSAARGGAREIVVRGGAVESVRTPLRGHAGIGSRPVIQLDKLAVDSDRAFALANQAAIRARVGFDSMAYRLEARPDGEPVWTLDLLTHEGGGPAGRVEVSAVTGEVRAGGLFVDAAGAGPVRRIEQDAAFLIGGFGREVSGFFERLGKRAREVFGGSQTEDRVP